MTSNHLSLLSQLTSSHWAGWVCAAIGAVSAGLYVVWLRPGTSLKSRQKSILGIAEAGLLRAKRIGEAFAGPGPLEISAVIYAIHNRTFIDGTVEALTNVPVHDIGSRDGLVALLSIRDQFRFLGTSIEIFETPTKDPGMVKRLVALDETERRQYLNGRQPTLAKNMGDCLATIQRDYEALARALNRGESVPVLTWFASSLRFAASMIRR
jgi:hypothetical protein